MHRLIPIVIVAIAVVALGQSRLFPAAGDSAAANSGQTPAVTPEAPHSPAAVEAKRKYDLTVKLAKEAYRKALVAADKDYIDALATAEDAAMKGGISDKPEADRLDAARVGMVDQEKGDEKSVAQSTVDKTFNWIGGTSWAHGSSGIIVGFNSNGSVACSDWNGKTGNWTPNGDASIIVNEPPTIANKEHGNQIKVTFSDDHKASIWEYLPDCKQFVLATAINR